MPKPSLDEIFGVTSASQKPSLDDIFYQGKTEDNVKKSSGATGSWNNPTIIDDFKNAFVNPVTKSITGKSLLERSQENIPFSDTIQPTGNPYVDGLVNLARFQSGLARDVMAETADSVTTPLTVATAGLAKTVPVKAAGNYIAGTKAGKAVSNFFTSDVGEYVGKKAGKVKKFIGDAWHKSRPDYIVKDVAPEAHRSFQAKVATMTPEVEKYAVGKLGVPKDAVDVIKKNGTQKIYATSNSSNFDSISSKIQVGLENKEKEISRAYQAAFSSIPDDELIRLNNTQSAMRKVLKSYGYIDELSRPTKFARPDVYEKSIAKGPELDAVAGFYQYLNPAGDFKGAMASSNFVGGITKNQWNLFRDNLSNLRKSGSSRSGDVTKILDALHKDAEIAGVSGINKARSLARTNNLIKDNISESLYKETKLRNYFKILLHQKKKRKIRLLERYINTPIVDDIESLAARQYLDKINEGKSVESFARMLDQASNPKYTKIIRDQIIDLLGQKDADSLIKEVILNRRLRMSGKVAIGAGALKASQEILNK